ncbi:MAG: preprotein translocase subunit SecE [Firmicutes bacterium]|nr:preprotein translocase subunit SecE [Bacillota bacterium]
MAFGGKLSARITGLVKFFREVRSELKKVLWPGRRETLVYTGVVIISVLFVSTLIWVVDLIYGLLLGIILPGR